MYSVSHSTGDCTLGFPLCPTPSHFTLRQGLARSLNCLGWAATGRPSWLSIPELGGTVQAANPVLCPSQHLGFILPEQGPGEAQGGRGEGGSLGRPLPLRPPRPWPTTGLFRPPGTVTRAVPPSSSRDASLGPGDGGQPGAPRLPAVQHAAGHQDVRGGRHHGPSEAAEEGTREPGRPSPGLLLLSPLGGPGRGLAGCTPGFSTGAP